MRALLACMVGASLLLGGCASAAPTPPSPGSDTTPPTRASRATLRPGATLEDPPCAKQREPLLCMFKTAANVENVDPNDGPDTTARITGALREAFAGCDELVFEQCARGGFLVLTFLALDERGRLTPEERGRAIAKGLAMLRRGCDGGAAQGCHVLGVLYESGHYVGPSAERAAEYYARACKGGIDAACAGVDALRAQTGRHP